MRGVRYRRGGGLSIGSKGRGGVGVGIRRGGSRYRRGGVRYRIG